MKIQNIILLFLLSAMFSSCSSTMIVKRKYRSGYHVQLFNKKKQSNFKELTNRFSGRPHQKCLENRKVEVKSAWSMEAKKTSKSAINLSGLNNRPKLNLGYGNSINHDFSSIDDRHENTKIVQKRKHRINPDSVKENTKRDNYFSENFEKVLVVIGSFFGFLAVLLSIGLLEFLFSVLGERISGRTRPFYLTNLSAVVLFGLWMWVSRDIFQDEGVEDQSKSRWLFFTAAMVSFIIFLSNLFITASILAPITGAMALLFAFIYIFKK
jgi:hypothetical protein